MQLEPLTGVMAYGRSRLKVDSSAFLMTLLFPVLHADPQHQYRSPRYVDAGARWCRRHKGDTKNRVDKFEQREYTHLDSFRDVNLRRQAQSF